MKLSLLRRKQSTAFTLVELLVVIGIIAILAGVIIAGVGNALRFAKRTKANAMAVQIQTAVQSYYTEYGIYPTADVATPGTPATDDFYSGLASGMASWQNMMYALCGNINPLTGLTQTGTIPNSRAIAYLAPTRGDMDANGILQNPFGSSATAPYFYMVVDTDYDGVVGDSSSTKLPDFTGTTYTPGTTLQGSGGTPGGIALWCSCDQPLAGASKSAFWAHTY